MPVPEEALGRSLIRHDPVHADVMRLGENGVECGAGVTESDHQRARREPRQCAVEKTPAVSQTESLPIEANERRDLYDAVLECREDGGWTWKNS